jgi:SPP1 family predicted phage head-tail adaptor
MAYQAGFRETQIVILNRTEQTIGKYGIDSAGVEWQQTGGPLWASVTWAKGNRALNAGALDAYEVENVRMNWTDAVNMRSRIQKDGKTYQILPETFHASYRKNEIEFKMQLIINE